MRKFFAITIALLALTACSGNKFLSREDPPAGTKVVVVEFSDFNCPACRTASGQAAKIKHLPNLYFEFRHFPLPISGHETSDIAANAYECARDQDLADEMESALFENQGSFSEKFFLTIPQRYDFGENFDSEKFKSCVTGNEHAGLVKRDSDKAISSGVNATPTFFVNGVKTTRSDLLETVQGAFDAAK